MELAPARDHHIVLVQPPNDGGEAFIIRMADHTTTAGQLADAFGNEQVAPLDPAPQMGQVVANHDAGWRELDDEVLWNPASGLPYHLAETPAERLVETINGSADANSEIHPYCGLISSMHSYGLYTGRYGRSSYRGIDLLPASVQPAAAERLERELTRQRELRTMLADDPDFESWVSDARLAFNYERLQFFDGLTLFLQCAPPGQRGSFQWAGLPVDRDLAKTVTATEVQSDRVTVEPWPFAVDEFTVTTTGRYLTPSADQTACRAAFDAASLEDQAVAVSRAN